MMDSQSVITTATSGIVKDLAASMEVSIPRMYEMLGGQCSYQKAKLLIRRIAPLNPDGARLIKADLDALFADVLGEIDVEGGTVVELHREAFEAVQASLTDKPVADQKKELRDVIAEASKMLQKLDYPTNGNGIPQVRRHARAAVEKRK